VTAELEALRAEIAELRERTDAVLRLAGLHCEAGQAGERREHQPWAQPHLTAVRSDQAAQ
jgi:hypothetical protein